MKKRVLFCVCVFLALILVLTGCPTEAAEEGPPSGNIGDKTLSLKGKVYTGLASVYTEAGMAYDGKVESKNNLGGEGVIKDGTLNFSISPLGDASKLTGTLDDVAFKGFSSVLGVSVGSLYDGITVTPADAKYTILELDPAKGVSLKNENMSTSTNSVKTELSTYIYLSKEVKITGTKKSVTVPYTLQSSDIKITLKKGWNIIYQKYEQKSSGGSCSLKVEKHSLKWVVN
jgi:hypothetical protein